MTTPTYLPTATTDATAVAPACDNESTAAAAATRRSQRTDAGRRRRARRYRGVTSALACAVALAWITHLGVGEMRIAPRDIVAVLSGTQIPGASFVIMQVRLPRALAGLLAGVAFALAGRTSQTMLRNELASPDVIGITSGACAGAVAGIVLWGWSGLRLSVLAIAAGLLTAVLIVVLSGRGHWQGTRLILIGIGVSAMLSSLVSYLQLRAQTYDVAEAMRWISGSLASVRWQQMPLLAVALVVAGGLLGAVSRSLRVLPLGDDVASALGENVDQARLALLLAIVILCACATAVTGPIAFVAFLSGPLTHRLVGACERTLLLPSALMGALLVLGGDLVGQYLFPHALPVGVVTGIVGAPYLLIHLLRLHRQGVSA